MWTYRQLWSVVFGSRSCIETNRCYRLSLMSWAFHWQFLVPVECGLSFRWLSAVSGGYGELIGSFCLARASWCVLHISLGGSGCASLVPHGCASLLVGLVLWLRVISLRYYSCDPFLIWLTVHLVRGDILFPCIEWVVAMYQPRKNLVHLSVQEKLTLLWRGI